MQEKKQHTEMRGTQTQQSQIDDVWYMRRTNPPAKSGEFHMHNSYIYWFSEIVGEHFAVGNRFAEWGCFAHLLFANILHTILNEI